MPWVPAQCGLASNHAPNGLPLHSLPAADGAAQLAATAVMLGGLVFALKITMSYMDPYRDQRREVGLAMSLGLG
jgi:hypothetical protein